MKMRGLVLLLIFTVSLEIASYSQQIETPASYSVSTIKPSRNPGWNSGFTLNGYWATGVSLRQLMEDAYGLYKDRFSGGPAWIESEKFDVQAKIFDTEHDTSQSLTLAQRQLLLQRLLGERFKLVVHHQSKKVPSYSLLLNNKGPKLKKSTSQDVEENIFHEPEMKIVHLRPGRFEVKGCSMEEFANFLTIARDNVRGSLIPVVGRLVVNKTELAGRYTFSLQWEPQRGVEDATGAAGPSIFTALKEQLGLKLKQSKGYLDIVVVDHAEKPSEN